MLHPFLSVADASQFHPSLSSRKLQSAPYRVIGRLHTQPRTAKVPRTKTPPATGSMSSSRRDLEANALDELGWIPMRRRAPPGPPLTPAGSNILSHGWHVPQ